MLVLSRKRNENIIVNGNIRIHIVSVSGGTVRVGIEAPREIVILRGELEEAAEAESEAPATVSETPVLKFPVDFSPEINP